MSNVIPLHPTDRAAAMNARGSDGGRSEGKPPLRLVHGVSAAALSACRYTVFLLLLWMRGPLRFLLSLFQLCALIALPILGFGLAAGAAHKAAFMLILGGGAFGAFVVSYFYDSLLLRLAPRPTFLA